MPARRATLLKGPSPDGRRCGVGVAAPCKGQLCTTAPLMLTWGEGAGGRRNLQRDDPFGGIVFHAQALRRRWDAAWGAEQVGAAGSRALCPWQGKASADRPAQLKGPCPCPPVGSCNQSGCTARAGVGGGSGRRLLASIVDGAGAAAAAKTAHTQLTLLLEAVGIRTPPARHSGQHAAACRRRAPPPARGRARPQVKCPSQLATRPGPRPAVKHLPPWRTAGAGRPGAPCSSGRRRIHWQPTGGLGARVTICDSSGSVRRPD